jgi:hypothetical protein
LYKEQPHHSIFQYFFKKSLQIKKISILLPSVCSVKKNVKTLNMFEKDTKAHICATPCQNPDIFNQGCSCAVFFELSQSNHSVNWKKI